MVYCPKCGTKNEDDAEICISCKQSLSARPRRKKHDDCFGSDRDMEDECFGLPHSGTIFTILIGVVIVFVGMLYVLSEFFDFTIDIWSSLWPLIIIIVGILIIAGGLYQSRRKD